MKRREFMKSALAATLIATASVGAMRAADNKQAKPNFLFILADDCTYNVLGCFGGKDVKTPNIDRLGRQGVKFNRAYAAMSMCAPFRAELYTGLYPVTNGVAWNHSKAKPGTKSICHHLGGLGYRVGLSGKKHASPGSVFPFENVKGFPAGDGVGEFMSKDAKQPFCLFLCSNNPHAAWTTGDASQFDPAKITLAPVQHDNPRTREAMTRYLAEVGDLDREVGEILNLLKKTGKADNTLVMFSSEQGWALGFAKWSNWNLGVHTGLLARWPGRIKPGTTTDALVQIADITPTFIEAAGGDPAKFKLDGRSFLPVLEGRAKEHRKYVYCIHNNVPEGRPYPIRSISDGKFHYLMNLKPDESYHEKHVMVANSRLAWWPGLVESAAAGDESAKKVMARYQKRPAEELYRVDTDPYELKNLADNPEYAAVKKRLNAELKRWMKAQKDPGAALDTPEAYGANRKAGGTAKRAPRKKKPKK